MIAQLLRLARRLMVMVVGLRLGERMQLDRGLLLLRQTLMQADASAAAAHHPHARWSGRCRYRTVKDALAHLLLGLTACGGCHVEPGEQTGETFESTVCLLD